ncbi:hypothetical protein PWKp9S_00069 [Klebsiella phage PWKp9S]|nr:hypothetical protein PWKp9S_00069 [Klebsiella phage PWKp9S]
MNDLSMLTKIRSDTQSMVYRRSELTKAKQIISGGTQQRFTLRAGDLTFDLCGELTRDYTFEMKPCYDMVKLGLIKALDKQIDQCTDAIKTLNVQFAAECDRLKNSIKV